MKAQKKRMKQKMIFNLIFFRCIEQIKSLTQSWRSDKLINVDEAVTQLKTT